MNVVILKFVDFIPLLFLVPLVPKTQLLGVQPLKKGGESWGVMEQKLLQDNFQDKKSIGRSVPLAPSTPSEVKNAHWQDNA